MPDSENESPDVVPSAARQVLILLWIALFCGRWVVVSLLQWNGFVTPEQVAALDEGLFSRLYLILLALTLLLVALRWVRHRTEEAASPLQKTHEAVSKSAPRSR